MKIDKQFHHIAYNDEQHKYWNLLTKECYKSVTSLISSYTPEFDTEGMSLNCAKRDVREGLTSLSVLERQQELKEQWEAKNRKSTQERGTPIHNAIELFLLKNETAKTICEAVNLKKEFRPFVKYIEKKKYKDRGAILHPEMLIYSDKYKLAGQSDLILEYDDYLEIYDWKTNEGKTLTYNCNYNTYFNPPLSQLPAGKLAHYAMQLSIYQIFAEEIFNKPVRLRKIIHFKDSTSILEYELEDYIQYAKVLLEDCLNKSEKVETFKSVFNRSSNFKNLTFE